MTDRTQLDIRSFRSFRDMVQQNKIWIPCPIPVSSLCKRADFVRGAVHLYFFSNWTTTEIGKRYGLSGPRILQILKQWVCWAIQFHYMVALEDPTVAQP
jgi:hypothetical protein